MNAEIIAVGSELLTPFRTDTVTMKPGDGLLLYTDGVTGAPNQLHERFGNARLEEYANLYISRPVEQMVLDLFTAVRFFSLGTAQEDDISVMALRYRGGDRDDKSAAG